MAAQTVGIGVLWRAEWDPAPAHQVRVAECRLHGVFEAFAELGALAEPVVYSDECAAAVREQLLGLDGVVVWVNPVQQGLDRSRLDGLLREAATTGVFVSAHPDVILKIATKRVLVDTAHMSWSAGARLFESHEQLASELVPWLSSSRAVVLKQHRGMGGAGVWKVELADGERRLAERCVARVQHAENGSCPQTTRLEEFIEHCRRYFAGDGVMVGQPFQSRLAEGMVRVYLCQDRVVGFAHEHPTGLLDPDVAAGLPTGKQFLPVAEPWLQRLRARVQEEWVPELQRVLGVDGADLPVIWDTDFLLGPKDADGQDSYVLCEINASSTFAFPDAAMLPVAQATLEQIYRRRAAR